MSPVQLQRRPAQPSSPSCWQPENQHEASDEEPDPDTVLLCCSIVSFRLTMSSTISAIMLLPPVRSGVTAALPASARNV